MDIAFVFRTCYSSLFLSAIWRNLKNFKTYQPFFIVIFLISCGLVQLFLVFFWHKAEVIFGVKCSFWLILSTCFIAFISASSNLIFMPYVATYHSSYLTAYFFGMGLSAFLPSILSLIQGAMSNSCVKNGTQSFQVFEPLFSVEVYKFSIFLWLCLGIIAFIILNWFPNLLSKQNNNVFITTKNKLKDSKKLSSEEFVSSNDLEFTLVQDNISEDDRILASINVKIGKLKSLYNKNHRFWMLIICLLVVSSQMNSIVPSIQIFSAMPYSPTTYHLALTLSNAAQSIACLLPLWLKFDSLHYIGGLTTLSMFTSAYMIFLSLQSPNPILKETFIGSFLTILNSILSYTLNAYLRTLITLLLHDEIKIKVVENKTPSIISMSQNESVERYLFWCGVVMQIGSFIGSLVMFPLINVFHIFKMINFC